MRGQFDYYEHLTQRPAFRNVVKLLRPSAYRINGHEHRFSDFRPHLLHPNHVSLVNDELWVTLWRTGEIVNLHTGNVLANDLGRPHDGLVFEDTIYITDCRMNRLIVHQFDHAAGSIGKRIADRTITKQVSDGFLRGVSVAGDFVFVGLTARRGASAEFQIARIVALDKKTLEPTDEWIVPENYGRQIFSILDASHIYS